MEGTKVVRNLIIGFLFVMAFLFTLSITGGDTYSFWKALGSQILFLVIAFLIYSSSQYQRTLLGIEAKKVGASLIYGVIIGVLYVVLTNLIPGLAIAVPLVPGAISTQLKFFIVVIVAPIVETIFFLGALLGYIRAFNPNKRKLAIAIVIQAVAFALFHLGTYIIGLYDLPGFTSGFLAFSANISVFISAVIFGLLSGYLVTREKFRGLLIAMIIHLIINASVYGRFAIISA